MSGAYLYSALAGLGCWVIYTQGVALGCIISPLWGCKKLRCTPGERPVLCACFSLGLLVKIPIPAMIKRLRLQGLVAGLLTLRAVGCLSAQSSPQIQKPISLEIKSVEVSGRQVPFRPNGEVNLGPFPGDIVFQFESRTNSGRLPIRLRYKLEGYENGWHEGPGEMYFGVRFYNDAGDQVSQDTFKIRGDSAGWSGSLQASSLTHRRETLRVPPRASRLMLVISSAGPPQTEGVYIMANVMVTKSAGSQPPTVLVQSPFEGRSHGDWSNQIPSGWMRDGNHASMAKIVSIGKDMATSAFAIFDDDPFSHAEWHSTLDSAAPVTPGEDLVVEWNEMYSMGVGDIQTANYGSLPVGNYVFRVEEADILGQPTGAAASLGVLVPSPFWRMPWFWGAFLIGITAIVFGGWRYLAWHRLNLEMLELKGQRALESERLRISHDIHDDLGARVTQISLLSAMSVENPAFPEKARADFDRISRMCRELVSALYETVWAVNPENDNLDALGNYLCQMVNQLCEPSQCRCRFRMSDLPREVQVSSQTRHNISMAVKEAVHNVIKHAQASEVVMRVDLTGNLLSIMVQDDGCGFEPTGHYDGNGLNNMKRRLEDIGGTSFIERQPGKGTTVHFQLVIPPRQKD
jgi:signal transduction histidine kinase